MFENLTHKMGQALRAIRGLSHLTETNVTEALKEVRTALLSADVHFKVARDFIENVKADCLGQAVIASVTPGQQIIKLIHDHLVTLLGEGSTNLSQAKPLRIVLAGLHGAGKTTTAVKLARYLAKQGYTPAVIACDVYRPAAVQQLKLLAQQENCIFYAQPDCQNVLEIATKGLEEVQKQGATAIIFDTAGRLQIDELLIEEIKALKAAVSPHESLLVADSAMGQEAVNVAEHFHKALTLTGLVLTKLDGDARGGAALSMKAITGVPIKLIGTGEKLADLDVFYPERMAQRILGMGDVVSLVEKAQEHIDTAEADRLATKLKKADFNLEDFLSQIRQIKKMGPLSSLLKLMPGMANLDIGEDAHQQMKSTEAIISSMKPQERQNPSIINGSRRLRIARGAGVAVRDVNQLLKQFMQMRKVMKSLKNFKGSKRFNPMAGL